MTNITFSLDNEVFRREGIKTAELDPSVSALVKKYLIDLAGQETEFERRKRLQDEILAKVRLRTFSANDSLTRDEAHDRRLAAIQAADESRAFLVENGPPTKRTG